MSAPTLAPISLSVYQALDLRRWFLRQAASHVRRHPRHREAMVLKLAHSIQVSRNCAAIGADLGLVDDHLHLARTVGLLHDVARFEQLIRYGTFVDRLSVDHGSFGADLLAQAPLVTSLPATARGILIQSVRHHNDAARPKGLTAAADAYLQLVRDADKLDIFRLMAEVWLRPGGREPGAEALDLSDAPEVSAAIAAAIQARRPAPMAAVRTRVDLLLVRLAWVFDLGFAASLRRLVHRGHMDLLAGHLPATPAIDSLVRDLQTHVAERLAAPDRPLRPSLR